MCGLFTTSCLTLCKPMTVACQTPLSMGFPRQEYWSGFLTPPSPGYIPDPGLEPTSLALQMDYLPTKPWRKPFKTLYRQEITIFSTYFFQIITCSSLTDILLIGLKYPEYRGISTRAGIRDLYSKFLNLQTVIINDYVV